RADAAIRAHRKGDDHLAAAARANGSRRARQLRADLARIVGYRRIAHLAALGATAAGLPVVAFFLAVRLPAAGIGLVLAAIAGLPGLGLSLLDDLPGLFGLLPGRGLLFLGDLFRSFPRRLLRRRLFDRLRLHVFDRLDRFGL